MPDVTLRIENDDCGKNVRDILRKQLKISSGLLKKLKKCNGIFLNGKQITVDAKVNCGDIISVKFPSESSQNISPVNIPIEIVYEDEYLLAINKPKDMPTHPSVGNHNNTVANACMYYFRESEFVFRPINRLDRDTTGLVMVAKDARTCAVISEQMKKGFFKKTYFAITQGVPNPPSGVIDAPIGRATDSIIKREVRDDGQRAVTEYTTVSVNGQKALIKINLLTGRTHQIRVHFAHIGTPLLYDYMYGKEVEGETLYLHCGRIDFIHPYTDEPVTIEVNYKFPFFD